MGEGSNFFEVNGIIDLSELSAGAVIVNANKNVIATYDGTTLNITLNQKVMIYLKK